MDRVFIKIKSDTRAKIIQDLLFSYDYFWYSYNKSYYKDKLREAISPNYYTAETKHKKLTTADSYWYEKEGLKEITLDGLIEWLEANKKKGDIFIDDERVDFYNDTQMLYYRGIEISYNTVREIWDLFNANPVPVPDLQFKVKSPQHSEVVQRILFQLGYKWGFDGQTIQYADKEYISVYSTNSNLSCCQHEVPGFRQVSSIDELVDILTQQTKPITIGKSEVKFEQEGVRIGCKFVEKELMDKIAKRTFLK